MFLIRRIYTIHPTKHIPHIMKRHMQCDIMCQAITLPKSNFSSKKIKRFNKLTRRKKLYNKYDETQIVAKNYDAACTPDFYIFDKDKKLVYRGQLDDSRPGNNIRVTGNDIRKAFDSILSSKKIVSNQKPSIGCNIKWID